MADEEWSHPLKEWRETLAVAKALKWSSKKTHNHNIIYLKCPSGACTEKAYSTGRGAESAALTIRRRIERCPHGDLTEPLAAAQQHLTNASRLLDAVEALLARETFERALSEALEMAELAEDQLSEAERNLVNFESSTAEDGDLGPTDQPDLDSALAMQEQALELKVEAEERFDRLAAEEKTATDTIGAALGDESASASVDTLTMKVGAELRAVDQTLRPLPGAHNGVQALQLALEALRQRQSGLHRKIDC